MFKAAAATTAATTAAISPVLVLQSSETLNYHLLTNPLNEGAFVM
jgi:hypothetical protein